MPGVVIPLQYLILRIAIISMVCLASSGCISSKLRHLEIRQKEEELRLVNSQTEFFNKQPSLNNGFGAEVFLSQDALNRFLAAFKGYKIPLEHPSGASISITQAQLTFNDGFPYFDLSAEAVDRSEKFHIRLAVRTSLNIEKNADAPELVVSIAIREIIPDFEFSIFHLGRSWFGINLLRIEAQRYADRLPRIGLPITGKFPIEVNPRSKAEVRIGDATLYTNVRAPRYDLQYSYTLEHAASLRDGLHLYFKVEREK